MKKRPNDYNEMVNYLAENYPEVSGIDFYKDIFPDNENAGDHKKNNDYTMPNAIYLYSDAAGKMHRRIMLKDTWENDYMTYVKNNTMTLCSGIAFRGRANTMPNAQRMHALIIDLDMVGLKEIRNFLQRNSIEPGKFGSLPRPTYIVASGGGVHLYYVFDVPIDLFPNIKLQTKQLKYNLIYKIWDYKMTTQEKDVQYQGIVQGYRMVGSINSKYGAVIRAFRTGPRVDIAYLNKYVREENQVDLLKPFRPTQTSLAQAKHDYPEWYQRRIVEKQKPEHWHIKKDLYEWWKRQLETGNVVGGHRYYYCMVLAIYAAKCDVPFTTLKKDMINLFDEIKTIEHDGDPFTMQDVKSALEAYDKGYFCFTINDIEHIMNIRINRNRRNGRPQTLHMKLISGIRDILHPGGTWRQGNGRKRKCEIVYNYRISHPDETVSQVARALQITRPTVYRWWHWKPEPTNNKE